MKVGNIVKEKELETQLVERLPSLLPSGFTQGSLHINSVIHKTSDVDILVSIEMPSKPLKFAIEVKNTDRVANVREAAHQIKRYTHSTDMIPMVAGWYIGERARQVLKDEGVGYIDLAGNLFFKNSHYYVEMIVDKNPFSSTPPLKNIFAPTSSRITRAMLFEPKRAWSISELSRETDVSLGQTYNTIEAMSQEELIRKDYQHKWELINPATLIDAWKKVYPTYQSHKYTFFSYESSYTNILNKVVEAGGGHGNAKYALSFFSGASFVAPYVRGVTKVQFYSKIDDIEWWKRELKLQEVQSGGNVEIYIPYDQGVFYRAKATPWRAEEDASDGTPIGIFVQVVSNVQLYMDLFNNPARGEEAAEFLRKAKLGF